MIQGLESKIYSKGSFVFIQNIGFLRKSQISSIELREKDLAISMNNGDVFSIRFGAGQILWRTEDQTLGNLLLIAEKIVEAVEKMED